MKRQGGFTLIELVVVLAILGTLIALSVPRYLGARQKALVAEGQTALQELKTMGWAYYLQNSTWATLSTGPISSPNPFGFLPPGGGCWAYSVTAATATSVEFRATATPAAAPRCGPLAITSIVDLTLNSDGSASTSPSL